MADNNLQSKEPEKDGNVHFPLEARVRRTIKFRLWDDTNSCFVPDDVFAVINGRERGDQLAICVKDWSNVKEGEIWYSFHKDYLTQFTGIKDKNGNEVYDGDILFIEMGSFAGWAADEEHFIVDSFHSDICYLKNILSYSEHTSCEVIGNIF